MWKLALLFSMSALIVMTVPALFLTRAMSSNDVDTVSGTVRFMDGAVDLPIGACVEVVLVDVTDQDALAIALGRQVIEDAGTLPVDFQIPYHTDQPDAGRRARDLGGRAARRGAPLHHDQRHRTRTVGIGPRGGGDAAAHDALGA